MENLGPLSEVASANQRPLMNSLQRMPRREKEGSSQGALARHPFFLILLPAPPPTPRRPVLGKSHGGSAQRRREGKRWRHGERKQRRA